MSDERPQRDPDAKNSGATIGMWTAIGVGVGTAMFAATDGAYWIAVGAGVGVALGAGIWGQRSKSSDE